MRSRTSSLALARPRAARPASSLVALLAGVLLLLMIAIVPLGYASHQLVNVAYPIVFAPSFGAVGALVALRQPHNPIGWLLLGVALLVGGSFDVES